MKITPELLQQILPLASEWARHCETFILQHGKELTPRQIDDAKLVGVQHPEKVRVLVVPHIPRPDDGILKLANDQIGLVTDDTWGLTLRYGIFIRLDGHGERKLLIHELVHTAQYERLGGLDSFLREYLYQCETEGYENAPMEIEARVQADKIISLPG